MRCNTPKNWHSRAKFRGRVTFVRSINGDVINNVRKKFPTSIELEIENVRMMIFASLLNYFCIFEKRIFSFLVRISLFYVLFIYLKKKNFCSTGEKS